MNYYEHHIGDYAEATGHLSWLEDAAYTRMLRKYYSTEKPLPADIQKVQRLMGARSKDELAAVEAVLNEFFELREDGWHQQRCDDEIAAFRASQPERDAKRSNEQLRLQRFREERSALFTELNAAGKHAPWNIGMQELRSLVEKTRNGVAGGTNNAPATEPATATATPATATHAPPPTSHTEREDQKHVRAPARTPNLELVGGEAKAPDRFPEFWAEYPRKEAKADALKAWGQKGGNAKADRIIADVKRRKREHAAWQDRQFVPLPASYLRGERWEDEIRLIGSAPQHRGRPDRESVDELIEGAL